MATGKRSASIDRRAFLAGGAAALGSAAATSHNSTAAQAPAFLRAQEQTEITFWFFAEWVAAAVEAFHQQNPNIRVDFQQLGYADVHTRLLTSLAAGSGAPDVVGIDLGYVSAFTAQGGLTDLLQSPFDAGQFQADLVEYKWAQGSASDGRLVAMPWDIGPAGFIYRVDILSEAGITTEPEAMQARIKTWDDWFALGEEFNAKLSDKALVADAIPNDIFSPMVLQQGFGWFDQNKVVIEEKATMPLQRSLEARERGVDANIEVGSTDWAAGIRNNAFAANAAACWAEGGIRREQPQTIGQWRAIRAPEGDYAVGGSFLALPEQSEKKEAAWEFIKYLTVSTEGALLGMREGGAFPSYRPAWDDPLFDQPIEFYGGQRAYRLWLDIAETVPGQPLHPGQRQADDIVGAQLALVEQEDKDPVQAMKDAEAEVLDRIDGVTA